MNTAPKASFTSAVSGLAVSVDGSGSTDAEGAVADYAWTWGDGSAVGSGSTASHTYASAGTYTVTLKVTDAGGLTDTTTTSVTVTASGPDLSAFLAADDFGRTAATGWGTSDKGGAWSTLYGSASATSVDGNAGSISIAAGQTRAQMLSSISAGNVLLQTDVALTQAPATGSSYVGVIARQTTAGDNYQVRVWFRNNGTAMLVTQRGNTTLGTYLIPQLTWAAGDSYTLKAQVTGTSTSTIQAKLWKTGTTEPANWQLTSVQSTGALEGAGAIGISANRAGSATTTGAYLFDGFRASVVN